MTYSLNDSGSYFCHYSISRMTLKKLVWQEIPQLQMYLRIFWLIVIFKGKRSSSALQALPAWKKKEQKQKQKHKNRVSLKTDYPNRHFCFLFLRDPCFKKLSFLKARFKRHIYISLVLELNVSWVRILWWLMKVR